MERRRDYGISLMRLIATMFIFTCHIMQYYDFELAWWFNVGVQIFLCMSGFLYGQREKIAPLSFYKKQLPKILIDYWLVIFIVAIIQFIFVPNQITIGRFIGSVATYGTLEGGGHLWYIFYILACYIGTPILAKVIQIIFSKKKELHLVLGTIALLMLSFLVLTILNTFKSAWINCYIIGFFLGFCDKNAKKSYKYSSITIAVLCVLTNVARIVINYSLKIKFEGVWQRAYEIFENYGHVFLGCAIFMAIRHLFALMFKEQSPDKLKRSLKVTDKLSYDIYLVHHFFIFGPLSLMTLTGISIIDVIVVLVATIVSAIAINCASNGIKRLFAKKESI